MAFRHVSSLGLLLALLALSAASRVGPQTGDITRQAVRSGGPREKLCQACTLAVQQLEVVLSDPQLVNNSIAILENALCVQLPPDQQQECIVAVEQYVPEIVSAMLAELTVDNICIDKTKLCPPEAFGQLFKGPEDCFACKLVVKLLKKHLSDPKTQANLEKFLVNKCALISNSTIANECSEAVHKFLPVIFANLDIILDAKKLCKETGLCSAALPVADA